MSSKVTCRTQPTFSNELTGQKITQQGLKRSMRRFRLSIEGPLFGADLFAARMDPNPCHATPPPVCSEWRRPGESTDEARRRWGKSQAKIEAQHALKRWHRDPTEFDPEWILELIEKYWD